MKLKRFCYRDRKTTKPRHIWGPWETAYTKYRHIACGKQRACQRCPKVEEGDMDIMVIVADVIYGHRDEFIKNLNIKNTLYEKLRNEKTETT